MARLVHTPDEWGLSGRETWDESFSRRGSDEDDAILAEAREAAKQSAKVRKIKPPPDLILPVPPVILKDDVGDDLL